MFFNLNKRTSTEEVLLTYDCAFNNFFLDLERGLLDEDGGAGALAQLVLLVADMAYSYFDEAEKSGSVTGLAGSLARHAKTFDTS